MIILAGRTIIISLRLQMFEFYTIKFRLEYNNLCNKHLTTKHQNITTSYIIILRGVRLILASICQIQTIIGSWLPTLKSALQNKIMKNRIRNPKKALLNPSLEHPLSRTKKELSPIMSAFRRLIFKKNQMIS